MTPAPNPVDLWNAVLSHFVLRAENVVLALTPGFSAEAFAGTMLVDSYKMLARQNVRIEEFAARTPVEREASYWREIKCQEDEKEAAQRPLRIAQNRAEALRVWGPSSEEASQIWESLRAAAQKDVDAFPPPKLFDLPLIYKHTPESWHTLRLAQRQEVADQISRGIAARAEDLRRAHTVIHALNDAFPFPWSTT